MHKLSISTIIFATTILLGIFFVNNSSVEASKPTISLKETNAKTLVIPDTVYSDKVHSNVLLNGHGVEGANISYTLVDTVNNTQELIREAITNVNGQDIVDSLPVLKHYVGIDEIKPDAYSGMVITNNGTGSDHLIRFSTNAKSVSKEAQIINMLGQIVNKIPLKYNPSSETYDAIWNGQSEIDGTYVFQAQTTNGSVASKIAHVAHSPSLIDNSAPIKINNQETNNFKNGLGDEDAKSKYAINISHESLEDYIDTVLVQENSFHDFFFNATGIQYENGNIFGNIFFTQGGNSPTNANVEYKQYNNQSNSFNTTAPNGTYNLQVPVVYEPLNPGQTKYIITLTENGDPFETFADTVLVSPGANNFTHHVVQIINPPLDTVYSDIVTSNVLLNGNGFTGANISYTLLDSITGNQELIREAITNAAGQDITDNLPVLPAETGLGMSKYIININHSDLEELIDTVRVQENTTHNFTFDVMGTQYADGHIYGLIRYVDLTGQPNSADVEYKRYLNQTSSFSTTATNGSFELDVPIVFEPLNPGQTKYIITISENGGDPFETLIDTLLISPEDNYITHYVNQTIPPDPEQDFEGIVRNVYSKLPESGVTVRLIDRTLGTLLQEETTGPEGSYFFSNIAQGTLVEFELGKPGELWMVNNEFDIPANITDTVATLNRYFYPKDVEVPQVGANTIIQGDGEEIAEITGPDIVNFEEILRDVDNMWANGGGGGYLSALTFIQDNFYEGVSPITTVSTARNITTTMQQDYDPYTNFYSGELGWNVNFGSGNTTSPLISTNTYGAYPVIGGEIMTTSGGSNPLAPYLKELQGQRLQLGNVTSPAGGGRWSFMNASAAMPTEKDRAYVHAILINQDGRFDTDQESYSLENMTSVEPTMKNWKDTPGNKPHSSRYFNHKKFDEQMQSKRKK